MATRKKAAGAKGKRRGAAGRRPAPADRAIDAALALAAARGWRHVSMVDVAEEASLSAAELYEIFPTRRRLLAGFTHRVDAALLGSDFSDLEGESPRDRLFDVLMRRLDLLRPYRDALAAIVRDMPAEPVEALCSARRLLCSMRWMLEAAGISSRGPLGEIRVRGLAGLWAGTLRVWFRDDSEDMSATMAYLDRRLHRIDTVLARCRGLGHRDAA